MRPVYQTIQVSATDVDLVAVAQAIAGAANMTLTGSQPAGSQLISITSDGDESGITFTVYGTDSAGLVISEAVTGPNNTTVDTAGYFATVTRIATSAAAAGNVSAGVVDEGAGPWVPLDYIQSPFNVSFACVVGAGTVDFTVQHTFDDVFALPPVLTAFDNAFVAGENTNQDGNYAFPVRAVRVKINSGSDPVSFTVLQGLTA